MIFGHLVIWWRTMREGQNCTKKHSSHSGQNWMLHWSAVMTGTLLWLSWEIGLMEKGCWMGACLPGPCSPNWTVLVPSWACRPPPSSWPLGTSGCTVTWFRRKPFVASSCCWPPSWSRNGGILFFCVAETSPEFCFLWLFWWQIPMRNEGTTNKCYSRGIYKWTSN